jgi:folate-binding protein YgfZ
VSALASSVESPALVPLPELGVVSVSGADAVAFLQSQVTNDVARLTPDQIQLSGYCTPKGRMLATFHQWRTEEGVFLRMPREVVASVVKRLSMFVLRAKVKVADVSDAWTTHAVLGAGSARHLNDAGLAAPDSPWTSTSTGVIRVDRMLPTPDGAPRFLLTSPSDVPLSRASPPDASNLWWLSEIDAAVPTVFAATQEKFVPQMINFEVLGGVDFKKGCYPGQEIVARSQYLGKLKRRMNIARVDVTDVHAAADVFHSDGAQPIGTVVMAATSPEGGSELLFEAPIDRLESGSLHLQSADGPRLTVRPLPYTLFDPTE